MPAGQVCCINTHSCSSYGNVLILAKTTDLFQEMCERKISHRLHGTEKDLAGGGGEKGDLRAEGASSRRRLSAERCPKPPRSHRGCGGAGLSPWSRNGAARRPDPAPLRSVTAPRPQPVTAPGASPSPTRPACTHDVHVRFGVHISPAGGESA